MEVAFSALAFAMEELHSTAASIVAGRHLHHPI
jgi:hypothetical protein